MLLFAVAVTCVIGLSLLVWVVRTAVDVWREDGRAPRIR